MNTDNIILYPEVIQRSEQWFRLRSGHLTASNFDKIITPKTGKASASQEEMIYELVASCVVPEEVTFEGNFYTDRGTALEPIAREAFVKSTGLDVMEIGFIRCKTAPIGCSPDGLIGTEIDKVEAGLEIKCPLGKTHVGYLAKGVLPDKYKAQVHGSMVVTGLKKWHFWSFHPDFKPLHVIVEWDDFTDKMQAVMAAFSEKYLEAYTELSKVAFKTN